MHPVTDQPMHFDLYRVDAHQTIKIEVPVHFAHQDECPGLKRGGTLNVALHTVTVSCTADHIPEEIVVNLTGLDIGSTVRISDLTAPENAALALPADAVVASIAGAMAEVVDETAEDETAEGEEPVAAEAEESSEGGEE
jgi:large subunit ribosomal protein L25